MANDRIDCPNCGAKIDVKRKEPPASPPPPPAPAADPEPASAPAPERNEWDPFS